MAPEQKGDGSNRIPINFLDAEDESDLTEEAVADPSGGDASQLSKEGEFSVSEVEEDDGDELSSSTGAQTGELSPLTGGPETAELVATRAELKRRETEVKELKEALTRRQADFENYRKRTERERQETYHHLVADITKKLLPVLDNLKRALDAEASVEASESDEFRHFLSGVDLIYKQLNGVLDALGVKPVLAEGEKFDPHLHEAVVTEPTDEYEPDMVMQEIVRGFRIGDTLIRPALVKVAVKK